MISGVQWARKLILLPALFPVIMLPFLGIAVFYILYSVNACIDAVPMDGIVRGGLEFQVTETYCSTLGEDAAISVFGVSRPGGAKVLLLKYGPESDEVPLPRIEVSNETITITVPVVSDISFQVDTWLGRRVAYEIKHVGYPSELAGGGSGEGVQRARP
jgi:hypothetical protein